MVVTTITDKPVGTTGVKLPSCDLHYEFTVGRGNLVFRTVDHRSGSGRRVPDVGYDHQHSSICARHALQPWHFTVFLKSPGLATKLRNDDELWAAIKPMLATDLGLLLELFEPRVRRD